MRYASLFSVLVLLICILFYFVEAQTTATTALETKLVPLTDDEIAVYDSLLCRSTSKISEVTTVLLNSTDIDSAIISQNVIDGNCVECKRYFMRVCKKRQAEDPSLHAIPPATVVQTNNSNILFGGANNAASGGAILVENGGLAVYLPITAAIVGVVLLVLCISGSIILTVTGVLLYLNYRRRDFYSVYNKKNSNRFSELIKSDPLLRKSEVGDLSDLENKQMRRMAGEIDDDEFEDGMYGPEDGAIEREMRALDKLANSKKGNQQKIQATGISKPNYTSVENEAFEDATYDEEKIIKSAKTNKSTSKVDAPKQQQTGPLKYTKVDDEEFEDDTYDEDRTSKPKISIAPVSKSQPTKQQTGPLKYTTVEDDEFEQDVYDEDDNSKKKTAPITKQTTPPVAVPVEAKKSINYTTVEDDEFEEDTYDEEGTKPITAPITQSSPPQQQDQSKPINYTTVEQDEFEDDIYDV